MRKRLLCTLLSALLLSLAWLGGSGVSLFVALVPLLLVSHRLDASRRGFRQMCLWTVFTSLLWHGMTVWWVWNAAPIGTIAATVVGTVLFGSVILLYHYVSKRARPALANTILVSAWIAAEWLYTTGQISFPWLVLGNGFARAPALIQWYEYTGVFGGSLWVLVVNLLLLTAVVNRSGRHALFAAIAVLVPVMLSLGLWFGRDYGEEDSAVVTIVQPDIDPYTEKFTLDQRRQTDLLLSLSGEAPPGVDFIVWPETAIDESLWEDLFEASSSLDTIRGFLTAHYPAATLVTGANTYRAYGPAALRPSPTARRSKNHGWYDVYNSALGLDTTRHIAVHHKSKLVIGVEMMPYMNLLRPLERWIVDLGGTTGQLGYGTRRTVFPHAAPAATPMRIGPAICYESVYGDYFADFVREGATLMAVITNDGWWGDTPGYRQHFSYSRLRAIETRRAIARSANTGISGFITPRGETLETLGWDRRGTLTASLPLETRTTFYVRYGDYIARLCNYIFLLGLLYFIAYRIRRRNHLTE